MPAAADRVSGKTEKETLPPEAAFAHRKVCKFPPRTSIFKTKMRWGRERPRYSNEEMQRDGECGRPS